MGTILTDVYELYDWWVKYFNTRSVDNENIQEWLHRQIKYDGGKLTISELEWVEE